MSAVGCREPHPNRVPMVTHVDGFISGAEIAAALSQLTGGSQNVSLDTAVAQKLFAICGAPTGAVPPPALPGNAAKGNVLPHLDRYACCCEAQTPFQRDRYLQAYRRREGATNCRGHGSDLLDQWRTAPFSGLVGKENALACRPQQYAVHTISPEELHGIRNAQRNSRGTISPFNNSKFQLSLRWLAA